MHGAPDDYQPRTDNERRFIAALLSTLPDLDVWPFRDEEGQPWILVSVDIVDGGGIRAVPRLDFDGASITGGYSPAYLNWDAELHATAAGIGPASPGWITAAGSPEELAAAAASWFSDRLRHWRQEARR